ncbi:hypothetical protein T4A_8965 [Trichinella pseudospiralis]|uniref:Uncharacterized protein n=1 Tax=Trichinella pseudospiralis TaxID=6337 RepID=A0A0V1E9L3_TRIPS|nr:hypothetical protein T4A_8965 [Trichinella pseudospiralis]
MQHAPALSIHGTFTTEMDFDKIKNITMVTDHDESFGGIEVFRKICQFVLVVALRFHFKRTIRISNLRKMQIARL